MEQHCGAPCQRPERWCDTVQHDGWVGSKVEAAARVLLSIEAELERAAAHTSRALALHAARGEVRQHGRGIQRRHTTAARKSAAHVAPNRRGEAANSSHPFDA